MVSPAPRRWRAHVSAHQPAPVHALEPGFGHGLMAALLLPVFADLGLSGSIQGGDDNWWPIHRERNLVSFELEHGVESKRYRYNARCFETVHKQKKAHRGEHAGYSNLFVPVIAGGEVIAVITTGPFAIERPTSESILAGWRWLTGRTGHPSDGEFASYIEAALSTLVLDGADLQKLGKLLVIVAQLLAGEGHAETLVNQAEILRRELSGLRRIERTWSAVETLVDNRSPRTLYSRWHEVQMRSLGLSRVADHVLVGLGSPSAGLDELDSMVRNDAFQRASVELARQAGNAIAGRVGNHGVVFLLGFGGKNSRTKARVTDFAERVLSLARRFELSLHLGVARAARSEGMSWSYQVALSAAESALSQGARLVVGEPGAETQGRSLWHAQRALVGAPSENAELLPARFDRYVEAVMLHSGYRFDAVRAYLEIGLFRLGEGLLQAGALDEKSFAAMCDDLVSTAREVRRVGELVSAYRRTVADMTLAVTKPGPARQDRHLRRAVAYIREHYTERLRFQHVARVAGFTPNYFSELFRKREGTTFERYVLTLRLERAKGLLERTHLDIARVAALSGFNSPQYFSRTFRKEVRTTPAGYRASQVPFAGRRSRLQRRRAATH